MQFDFDEKANKAIVKSVKSAQRFYNELRRAALIRGESQDPPSLQVFTTMVKGLVEATKQLEMDRLRNSNLRGHLENVWKQKLLNYSTQKLMQDSHEALVRRFK